MKKMGLALSLMLVPAIAQANDFLDNVSLFLLQAGFYESLKVADIFLHSNAGQKLIDNFRVNYIEKLSRQDVKDIRRALETGTIDVGLDNSLLKSLSIEKLERLKELIPYLQAKLRTPHDFMHKDIVDDLANCGICLVDQELLRRKYGENPDAKDYLFGVLLSKQTAHYLKTRAMLKFCKWHLAIRQDK